MGQYSLTSRTMEKHSEEWCVIGKEIIIVNRFLELCFS